jgi:hypothetical protein
MADPLGRGALVTFALAATLAACAAARPGLSDDAPASTSPSSIAVAPETSFARLVASLSEPGGFFDSDNLISNETSYLHVLDAMRRTGVRGGAYLGVGPDQNFSYIAAVRPSIALMIDIRRDNMLEHLLFKALFAMSRTRMEYLGLLLGRPAPGNLDAWRSKSIEEIVEYFDHMPSTPGLASSTETAIEQRIAELGLDLSPAEVETIRRIRMAFVSDSLSIRYSSLGRAPRPYHPTYRMLLLEKDRSGRQANYLATEDAFQYLKGMQARNLIVPVVGNLAGDSAMTRVSRFLAARGDTVSAFYVSNVEQYLMRDGTFAKFAANVKLLPHNRRSVMIRSFFGTPFGSGHPLNVPGHTSTSMLQTIDSLLGEVASGSLRSYFDLVGRNYLDP